MNARSKKNIWVISSGDKANNDFLKGNGLESDAIKIYRISEIGKYLLSPSTIEVEERIIGYTLHFKQPKSNLFKQKIKKRAPFLHRFFKEKSIPSRERLISPLDPLPLFDDPGFQSYMNSLYDLTRPFHPMIKEIERIDAGILSDITGICEDSGGSARYTLTLRGTIPEKIDYLKNFLGKKIRVTLKSAYLADGLFEMRGFDFVTYSPDKWFYLVKYASNQTFKYAVLDQARKVLFHVEDRLFIRFIHILDQSLHSNENLKEAFSLCMEGGARPTKLFFTKKLDISYSTTYLPPLYRRIFDERRMEDPVREMITEIINNHQRIVTFGYIPQSHTDTEKTVTTISVMHDIRALEPVKIHLPDFYSKITEITMNSDAGSYYLLDSMKGFKDV